MALPVLKSFMTAIRLRSQKQRPPVKTRSVGYLKRHSRTQFAGLTLKRLYAREFVLGEINQSSKVGSRALSDVLEIVQ
jgi:hypothetical protein